MNAINIFWFRRDLRLEDNAALYHALKGNYPVLPIFIFDSYILDRLEDKKDQRVTFIYKNIKAIQLELVKIGSGLEVFYGKPEHVFMQLLSKYKVSAVYTNHDYEHYAQERDKGIEAILKEKGIVTPDEIDRIYELVRNQPDY